MSEKQMIKCPVCENKFIPRTFYPEDAIFSTSDGKKLSGFNGYLSNGIKPPEAIISTWKTYCPNCNYVLNFVKELVKKEKIQDNSISSKDIQNKYNSYYFGFPFGDYTHFLKEVSKKVEQEIEITMHDLNMEVWENLYNINDNFKFLVRFFASLENYCDNVLDLKNVRDLPNKIKKLKVSKDVEQDLLLLNNIKDAIVHGEYDLTKEEEEQISTILVRFILYLINKHITPLITKEKLDDGYDFIDFKDLKMEVKTFLGSYLYAKFNNEPKAKSRIRDYLEGVFEGTFA
ncbi:MAG: hypothetical protein ACFFFB_16645 [Candidatus Heimdallarchaeota archaeon]